MKVLVLSDVHANLVAFEAVLQDAGEVDAIWNIGDTVGYGPKPAECVDLMISVGADPVLVGNHDLACLGELDLAEFNPVAQIASRWTATQLGPIQRTFLAGLPATAIAESITLAHGSPRAPVWEYLAGIQVATENFGYFTTQVCIVGHTHVSMCALLRDDATEAEIFALRPGDIVDLTHHRFILNPGSVGQPRDRDPRAAYVVLDTDRGIATAHRVEYDVEATQEQMRAVHLPDVLVARLAFGM